MMVRTGKALAQERAWREARQGREVARIYEEAMARRAAPPLRDDATFWLCVCVLIAFVAALFMH